MKKDPKNVWTVDDELDYLGAAEPERPDEDDQRAYGLYLIHGYQTLY